MRNRSRKKTENRNKEMRKNSAGKYKTRKEEKYMRKDTAKRQTDDPQSFRVQQGASGRTSEDICQLQDTPTLILFLGLPA